MAQKQALQQHVEGFISRAHDEVLRASDQLSRDLPRDSEGFVQPIGHDLTHLVDEVFDFAHRVLEGQRQMITQVLEAIDDVEPRSHARTTPAAAKRTTRSKSPA